MKAGFEPRYFFFSLPNHNPDTFQVALTCWNGSGSNNNTTSAKLVTAIAMVAAGAAGAAGDKQGLETIVSQALHQYGFYFLLCFFIKFTSRLYIRNRKKKPDEHHAPTPTPTPSHYITTKATIIIMMTVPPGRTRGLGCLSSFTYFFYFILYVLYLHFAQDGCRVITRPPYLCHCWWLLDLLSLPFPCLPDCRFPRLLST